MRDSLELAEDVGAVSLDATGLQHRHAERELPAERQVGRQRLLRRAVPALHTVGAVLTHFCR